MQYLPVRRHENKMKKMPRRWVACTPPAWHFMQQTQLKSVQQKSTSILEFEGVVSKVTAMEVKGFNQETENILTLLP